MSSTNKTPNYGLPQYIDTDKPTFLGDFNDAMGIIDKGMNDNKNSAGEGSNKMDEANARIGDAEETLTETQNQVDNISGLADTIETKVQTALTQANDAATKSSQANTNSTAAVNAANQASTDANAALQQAQGNVSQINGLDARVRVLEDESIKTFTQTIRLMSLGATGINQSSRVVLNPYIKNIHMSGGAGSATSVVFTILGKNGTPNASVPYANNTDIPTQYLDSEKYESIYALFGEGGGITWYNWQFDITYGK